ncbi:protein enabled isoform X2 [Cryptotermes secundus]|uniref:protein enabled isoform X2 n=1 Tax=Cryptotermes secundus TaxID=105785 RepID=UPI001454D118|nr:protein enabled isoform X2 [Cryptotermes secundus]XP_033606616.1 protein enabled isoform X2 [Cryptotermes secundus]XP_033606617.1 protein enabled isoform X2 [Cryptotermes secundus]
MEQNRENWKEYWACEQSIASARASVMVYDDVSKKWIPSGTSSGLSKVHIYQHQINNTFRVVGRKLQDHEVVINCAILKGLKYNQATATFHQWRDNKQVYGLNFSTKEDADSFARAMFHALDMLSNSISRSVGHPSMAPVTQPIYQPMNNGQYEEDMGYSQMVTLPRAALYHQVPSTALAPPRIPHSEVGPSGPARTMTREDVAIIQERRMSQQQQQPQQQQILGSPGSPSPGAPAPPAPPGHHRTSSAPPAPQPQPMALAPPTSSPQTGVPPPAPPAPPCPPWLGASSQAPVPPMAPTAAAPPPPPPPPALHMSRSSSSDGQEQTSSLAAQLQSAKLRRSNKQSAENSGSSTSSSGSSSNYGTIGRGGMASMSSMMDEMAKTLARRRKAVEKKEQPDTEQEGDTGQDKKPWGDKTSTNGGKFGASGGGGNGSGSESPKPSRKRFGSASEEQLPKLNGLPDGTTTCVTDFDSLKQEILKEMKKEMAKLKQDIIDAVRMEFARR